MNYGTKIHNKKLICKYLGHYFFKKSANNFVISQKTRIFAHRLEINIIKIEKNYKEK